MSLADNSLIPPEEPYQRQMTSYRRTRSAIMDSARTCLQTQGYGATSMIDIADTAEVSRATLYNHFRDKTSVFRAFAIHESELIFNFARAGESVERTLEALGTYVSNSALFERMRKTDPGLLATLLSSQSDPLWEHFRFELAQMFGERAGLVLTWLIGQALAPLTPAELSLQIEQLAQLLLPTA